MAHAVVGAKGTSTKISRAARGGSNARAVQPSSLRVKEKTMNNFERRISAVEFRATSTSKEKIIEGIAARYNSLSAPIPTKTGTSFRERIMPGAFADVLKSN